MFCALGFCVTNGCQTNLSPCVKSVDETLLFLDMKLHITMISPTIMKGNPE